MHTYAFMNSTTEYVLYRLPATGSRSPGIPCRESAINDSLAPKPSPSPNPNHKP